MNESLVEPIRTPMWAGGTCLRELKLRNVELSHDLIPKHVGGSEKPAPPATLLIGPRTGLEVDYVIEDVGVRDLGCTVQQRGMNVVGGQHGPGEPDTGI